MKILSKFLLFSIASLMLWSCKKDETMATATDGKASVLTASSTTLVLAKPDAANTAVTFTFTAADYGFDAAVTSVLQIAAKGTNFASPKELALDANVLTKSFTVIDFNALLLALNLATNVASPIEVRVKSTISASVSPVYSNVSGLTVTPYPLTSFVYVPGDYQGWNPSTADSLISATSNGIYIGVINYNAGGTFQFKITTAKNWNKAYGDAGGGTISTSGGNLTVPGAGSYKLTVDLNANTFAAVPLLWGIIGSATPGGWGSDTDMKYDNGKQTWSVTANLTAGGEIKFRKNHDWGTNFGGSNGTLVAGGDNIPVAVAGSYKITLDLVANTYTLTKL